MSNPTPNPNWMLEVLQFLFKPLAIIFHPLVVRWEHWTKRKPKMFFQFDPSHAVWTVAKNGTEEIMQATCALDITQDDPSESLFILDIYPEGTTSTIPCMSRIELKPKTTVFFHRVDMFAKPLIGEKGKDWHGRLVFVDQFNRKYRTKKHTFRFIGVGTPAKP